MFPNNYKHLFALNINVHGQVHWVKKTKGYRITKVVVT